jgi:heat shock protein HslJ
MSRRFLIPALLLAVAGHGCSEGDLLTAPTSNARLEGTWQLVQIASGGVQHTEAPGGARFAITFADDRVLLKADCNTCAGQSRLADDQLTLGLLACTRAFCASAPLDTQFTQAVETTHTVRLDATRLVLSSARGEVRFQR